MFSSTGELRYSENQGQRRLVLTVDPGLASYYHAMIPKYIDVSRPRYAPHITVVRPFKETVPDPTAWGRYEGEQVEFLYDHVLYQSEIYFWLNILSRRLEDIREELGLPVVPWPTRVPPPPFRKFFHCTVANRKLALLPMVPRMADGRSCVE
jgi:hypothetical protein